MNVTIEPDVHLDADRVRVSLPPMTGDEFWEFCQRARDKRIERSAEGEVIITPPAGAETGSRSGEILRQLSNWNIARGEPGVAFDSSTGFDLPNGATRSPDTSWVAKSRWDALTDEERQRFAPLCQDFVVELMSPSDRLTDAREKMDEYIANGARLGWLIDRKNRKVYVYRAGVPVETLDDPATATGDPELPGFTLDMNRVF